MQVLVRSLLYSVLAAGASAQTIVIAPPAPSPTVVFLETAPVVRQPEVAFTPVKQVTYYIAFKKSVVRLADQYWVTGSTIHFVTKDHVEMSAPLDTVDRVLSQQLNSEQNVAFILPAVQVTEVRARLVRHTPVRARSRTTCPPVK